MKIEVYPSIPSELESYLEERYHSSYTTREYYNIFIGLDKLHSFVLKVKGEIVDVLIYELKGHICTIRNKVTDIPESTMSVFCEYIFKHERKIREIIIDDILNPYHTRSSFCYSKQIDVCINLPGTTEAYHAMLGRKATKMYRYYDRKLYKELPDIKIITGQQVTTDTLPLLQDLSTLKNKRFKYLKKRNSFQRMRVDLVSRCALKYGVLFYVKMGNQTLGGLLCYKVKDEYFAIVIAFDMAYHKYGVARLMFYNSILFAISEGCSKYHFLWGGANYVKHYRGDDVTLYTTHFFRRKGCRYAFRKLRVACAQKYRLMKSNALVRKIYNRLRM